MKEEADIEFWSSSILPDEWQNGGFDGCARTLSRMVRLRDGFPSFYLKNTLNEELEPVFQYRVCITFEPSTRSFSLVQTFPEERTKTVFCVDAKGRVIWFRDDVEVLDTGGVSVDGSVPFNVSKCPQANAEEYAQDYGESMIIELAKCGVPGRKLTPVARRSSQ